MNLVDYDTTIDYLYKNLPMFSRIGAAAIKADLGNTIQLCAAIGNPENKFKSVHVAGTNGKGSSSHTIAAILQSAGYKVGLYTSPHLKDFRERIRINGEMIAKDKVVELVNNLTSLIATIEPSFFEITVAMAFKYFADAQVDIAVIETGLGGRLDSTNVITPLVSLITNIGYDHQALLGNTLAAIAFEKAGIIKRNIPVVISETQESIETVFIEKANQLKAPITFADKKYKASFENEQLIVSNGNMKQYFAPSLKGNYQTKNICGVLCTIDKLIDLGFEITRQHIETGIENVTPLTGLHGRWETIRTEPLTIADVAHNVDGMQQLLLQVNETISIKNLQHLHVIIGMVSDKDVDKVLSLLPKSAKYYFTQAAIPRAKNKLELQEAGAKFGLIGNCYKNVNEALIRATENAHQNDLILVCGSIFLIAELDNSTS